MGQIKRAIINFFRDSPRLQKYFDCYGLQILLFLVALSIRIVFYGGLSMGNDLTEIQTVKSIFGAHLGEGSGMHPDWTDPNYYNFHNWLLSGLLAVIFGLKEWTFFLPHLLISSAMPVLAFMVLTKLKFDKMRGFLGGLVVACAPFEILLGTIKCNDLLLALFITLGVLATFNSSKHRKRVGAWIGFLFWNAFYVKTWAIYWTFPLLWFLLNDFRTTRNRDLSVGFFATFFLLQSFCFLGL